MQAFVVGATLAGSMATAFVLQRALLEAWLRAMHHQDACGGRIRNRGRQQQSAGGLALARAALRILQLRLAHLHFLALGFADQERAASDIFRFVQFLFSSANS